MATLKEFLATSASPTRVAKVKVPDPHQLRRESPDYAVALLALHAEHVQLNSRAASRFIRVLLQTHTDKAECADYLHRVFLPLAEQSGDNTLWTNLAPLAIYLDQTAIALRAAKQSGNTQLQHYLAWGLDNFQPAADDPLGGRNPPGNPPGGQQSGVTIGILDYKSPNHKQPNNNISDVINSVAFMRCLARFYQPHWLTGDPRLATAMQFLQRTWPDHQRQPSAQPVNVRIFDRDSAWAGANPTETTYLPLYGWFAKLPFGTLPAFPLPPHIQPLFLSIHLHEPPKLLTTDTIAWLKTCEPIGCRDRTTSDYLAGAGVQAFFAGCLTTTLQLAEGSVGRELTPRTAHYHVDLKTKAADSTVEYTTLSQNPWHRDHLSRQPFAANVLEAIDLLLAYQQAKSVLTSSWHCYLTCRALGTAVTYCPTDPELNEQNDLSPGDLHRMQTTLCELTAQILAKIFSGAAPAEVRATWRELTAPLVAATAAERNTHTPLFVRQPPPSKIHPPKDPAANDTATEAKATNVVQVAMAFDANIIRYVPNVVRSIQAHSTAAVAYHFLIDDVPAADQATLHQACPDIDCTWYDLTTDLNNVSHHPYSSHLTRSTQSRLLLPDLLPQIDKVVYLDVDIIVLGDIAELAATELGTAPLAACIVHDKKSQPFQVLQRMEVTADRSAKQILELQRAAGLSADLTAHYFNAGVLVLSLDTLRRDHFTAQALNAAAHYGLSNQQILNLYTGGHYVRLSPKWNLHHDFTRYLDLDTQFSGIIHWKGKLKPWREEVAAREIWQRFSATD